MAELRTLPVPDGLIGERVDIAVARMLGLSRNAVADLAAQGQIGIAESPGAPATAVGKSHRLEAGQWLEVALPEVARPAAPEPIAVPGLTVLYADDDVAVVDKPVGVAAHPSPGWEGPTVVSGVAAAGHRVSTSGAAERQGVVHRLDAGTTGVMVVAKSEAAYTSLKRQFRERTVAKTYHAVVQGHPDPSRGTVDAPIDRHPTADWRFAVVAGGRPSVTHYETLEAFRFASLLTIGLETGRTHQIRVHMSAIHHPCVGDLAYGADPSLAERLGLRRQWLHARRLGFEHPGTGRWVEFTSDYPSDLQHALDLLRDWS